MKVIESIEKQFDMALGHFRIEWLNKSISLQTFDKTFWRLDSSIMGLSLRYHYYCTIYPSFSFIGFIFWSFFVTQSNEPYSYYLALTLI